MNRKSNNFNLLRLLFSVAVVFSHAGPMTGHPEPVLWLYSLGAFSVHGFFVISGYLIAQSYMRNPNVIKFSINRALRILPGLVFALIVGHAIWNFCDDFSNIPLANSINGSLWTLPWEAVCYIACGVIGLLGMLNKRSFVPFFASAWLLYICNLDNKSEIFIVTVNLVMLFMMGSFIAVMEGEINFSKAALIGTFVLFVLFFSPATNFVFYVINHIHFYYGMQVSDWQIHEVPYLIAMPFVLIYIGGYARTLIDIKEDLSYGIYILGWPIAQGIVWLFWKHGHPLQNPLLLFALTMPVLLIGAFVSWRLVEHPALQLKRYF